MNDHGKSDRPVVLEKPPNKGSGGPQSAEEVEGRGNTGVASCLLTFRGAAPVDAVYRDRPLSERGEWGQVLLSDLSREVR